MIKTVYNDDDFESVSKQKKLYKAIIFIALGVYLAYSLCVFFIYRGLPYKAKEITYIYLAQFIGTFIFIVFIYVFVSIKFSRVMAYYKLLTYINSGIMESNYGEFLRFERSVEVKERVDFKYMIMSEWSAKKSEYFERKVLLDIEKPMPEIGEGDKVKYTTQGNVLVDYEVVEKGEEKNEEVDA